MSRSLVNTITVTSEIEHAIRQLRDEKDEIIREKDKIIREKKEIIRLLNEEIIRRQ